jgi:hypothetical protein
MFKTVNLQITNAHSQNPAYRLARYFSMAYGQPWGGTSKLLHLQFDVAALAARPVGSLNGYQLTWFYCGYSRMYALILGMTQVGGSTLLLFRKPTLLGAVLMLPVMANILLINIIILVNDTGLCGFGAHQLVHARDLVASAGRALVAVLGKPDARANGLKPDSSLDTDTDCGECERNHDFRHGHDALRETETGAAHRVDTLF